MAPTWPPTQKRANGQSQNWLNAVANKQYIHQLRQVILHLHNTASKWVKSVPVEEIYNGQTIWSGTVEVFDLTRHPKAKRAYAWSHLADHKDERTRFVAVLELPPVVSPETAVKTSIAADAKAELKKQTDKAAAAIAKRNQLN